MPHILIIDDDATIRTLLTKMLSKEGFDVTAAENGRVAEAVLNTKDFDLVITDLVMPEKEGLEMIMDIMRTKPTLPVIAISGDNLIDRQICLEMARHLGARHTFAKPIDTVRLMDAIRECLQQAGKGRM